MQYSETDKSNALLLPARRKSTGRTWLRILVGFLLAFFVLLGTGVFLVVRAAQPREAPEAGRILEAQGSLPFQVLIPAYLPAGFKREQVDIRTDEPGPLGEPVVRLTYATGGGDTLVFSEWIPANTPADGMDMPPAGSVHGVRACRCVCASERQCTANTYMIDAGLLRVMAEMSAPELLPFEHLNAILTSLGPASGLQTTIFMKPAPPPAASTAAVEIPVSADGLQEVVLVVTPDGYSPAHFSVKVGLPVRLTFRQLGYVGCGNELIFQSGPVNQSTLALAGPDDQQVLEFTPKQVGDFTFNCPHLIYQGVMTVVE